MNINHKNPIIRIIFNNVRHYNPEKYWRMRKEVVNPNSKLPKVIRFYYLYRIKRMDAFNNASMGTDLGKGAHFEEPPILWHGLNGIIISHHAKIGRNCQIHQHVTIGEKQHKAATIGDNVFIGAGAVILGNVTIGDNVFIGANAVVTKDIPSNSTAVGVPAKVIPNKQ